MFSANKFASISELTYRILCIEFNNNKFNICKSLLVGLFIQQVQKFKEQLHPLLVYDFRGRNGSTPF